MQEAWNEAPLDRAPRNARSSSYEGRSALRAALLRYAVRFGFDRQGVDLTVDAARVQALEAGVAIDSTAEGGRGLGFVISGVVRVVYSIRKHREITLMFVPPGRFFRLAWPAVDGASCTFCAVAHVPALVATLNFEVTSTLLDHLAADGRMQFVEHGWRSLTRHLNDRCLFLALPLHSRVLAGLRALAHDFGRETDRGIVIDLPLTCRDLAGFVVGARANVARAISELRRANVLAVIDQRFVLLRKG